MSEALNKKLESARAYAKNQQLAEAESTYRAILQTPAESDTKIIAIQENALYELGKLYQEHK